RKLQENGMVKRTYQRGTRKHMYMAEKDFFRSFMSFYCQMWEREVQMNMEALEEAEVHLAEVAKDENNSAEIRDESKENYNMIERSKVYYKWIGRLAKSIQSGEIFEFLPKDPSEEK